MCDFNTICLFDLFDIGIYYIPTNHAVSSILLVQNEIGSVEMLERQLW